MGRSAAGEREDGWRRSVGPRSSDDHRAGVERRIGRSGRRVHGRRGGAAAADVHRERDRGKGVNLEEVVVVVVMKKTRRRRK